MRTFGSKSESSPSAPAVAYNADLLEAKLLLQDSCGFEDLGSAKILVVPPKPSFEIELGLLRRVCHGVFSYFLPVEAIHGSAVVRQLLTKVARAGMIDQQVGQVDGCISLFGKVISEQTIIGEFPAKDIVKKQYGYTGVRGASHIDVVLSQFFFPTLMFSVPGKAGNAALRHDDLLTTVYRPEAGKSTSRS